MTLLMRHPIHTHTHTHTYIYIYIYIILYYIYNYKVLELTEKLTKFNIKIYNNDRILNTENEQNVRT